MALSLNESYKLGYNSNYLGFYFNSVEFISKFIETSNQQLKDLIMGHFNTLKTYQPQMPPLVVSIQDILTREGWPSTTPPRFPNEFYNWAENLGKVFGQYYSNFQSPNYLAYDFGKRVGDYYASMYFLNLVSDVASKMNMDMDKQVESILQPLKNSFLLFAGTAKIAAITDPQLKALYEVWFDFLNDYLNKLEKAGKDYKALFKLSSEFMKDFKVKEEKAARSFS